MIRSSLCVSRFPFFFSFFFAIYEGYEAIFTHPLCFWVLTLSPTITALFPAESTYWHPLVFCALTALPLNMLYLARHRCLVVTYHRQQARNNFNDEIETWSSALVTVAPKSTDTKVVLYSLSDWTPAVNQCYTHSFTLMKHETCLSNTAGLKECSHFPFPSLPSIRSNICDRSSHWPSVSTMLYFFLVPPLLLEWGCWLWLQFLIHIGSGRWIWSSCSLSLFHFKLGLLFQLTQWLHGYSKWMNMLATRGERIYFSEKLMFASFFFFFSSAETLIISKTANIGGVFVWTPCVYSSPRL